MKKIISILLVALMVVPFGMLAASAATVNVPAEPTVTTDNKYYISFASDATRGWTVSTTGGATPENPRICNTGNVSGTNINSWGDVGEDQPKEEGLMYNLFKAGGTVVIVGKGHVGTDAVVPATTTPILFTAVDGTKDYTGRDADGNIFYMNSSGGNGDAPSQYGMFMVAAPKSITFEGDVIFDDVCILERSGQNATVGGKIIVGSTGKMVIGEDVKYLAMHSNGNNDTQLVVNEGGYLYLHTLQDFIYAGKGTIVVDSDLKATATEDMFAGFEGKVVDENGADFFAPENNDDQQGGNAGNENPDTGDMTTIVAVVAVVAIFGACTVLTLKKREQN